MYTYLLHIDTGQISNVWKYLPVVWSAGNFRRVMTSRVTSYVTVSSAEFSAEFSMRTLIGEGTFSEVWSCVRRNNGRKFAAKILKMNYGPRMNADAWSDISEVNVSNSVKKHPFLLLIEEAYHDRNTGKVILVTELMNKSLYDIIEDGECPLPEYRVKIYMYQMLEGTLT